MKISDELRDKSLSDSRPDPGHDETDFLGQCISHLINKNEKALESVPATANRNSDLESAFNALCSDITNHNDDKGKADTSREVNIVDIVLDYIKKEQVEESYTEGVFTEIKQEPVDFEQDNLEQGGADVMEKRSMKAQGQSSSEGRRSGDGKGQSFGEDQGQMLDPPSCSEDESDTDENTQNGKLCFEPYHKITCHQGFQPGSRQTWLYSLRRWPEA